MRKTVNIIDWVVRILVTMPIKFQAVWFNLLVLAFGARSVGKAFQSLMQSPEVVSMAVSAGCAQIPDKLVAVVEDRLNGIPAMPVPPPVPIDAEFLTSRSIVFEAGPYKLLHSEPPNEDCPYWQYAFTGPGFELTQGRVFVFVGCTEKCGESHMGALARAYEEGQSSVLGKREESCNSR